VSHVLPVSDDGGSTAEIVRVLGGPAVGDIRSRCLRLSDASTAEARAVKRLLGHRLQSDDNELAKREWQSILELESELWDGVSEPYKHTIKAFLVQFQTQLLRVSTEDGGQRFCFANGSVGNFFFAGARTFFRSLDAAIFLYSRVSGIPSESYVLPVIQSDDRLLLGAELFDRTLIRGQNEISHPNQRDTTVTGDASACDGPGTSHHANVVDKSGSWDTFPAPIRRVLYLSTEGGSTHEVFPKVNPSVLQRLAECDCVIYGMGSLYTSILPALILSGVGETIAARNVPKLLLLNGTQDRETAGMTAADVVEAVQGSLNRCWREYNDEAAGRADGDAAGTTSSSNLREEEIRSLQHDVSAYCTAVLYPKGCEHAIDEAALAGLGVREILPVESREHQGNLVYDCDALVAMIRNLCCR